MKTHMQSIPKLILIGLGIFASCTNDRNQTKLQYFPDMADSPAFKTQGNYIDPPEGSISRSAILYPDTVEEAEQTMENPFAHLEGEERAKHIANGKIRFENHCSICHGLTGNGDSNIQDKFPRPPDLRLDMYKQRKDGFFFYRITFGSALMPGYGYAISQAKDRWDTVLYVRELQNQKIEEIKAPESKTPEQVGAP